ncbi:MAG: response regulator [bacterium]
MSAEEKKLILVVDDEPDVRTFFETALLDAGFDVVTAGDGEEALELVKKRAPDLVSLDLVMPKKSGVVFLHEMRRNRKWSAIPVLIVTAHARDEMGSRDLDRAMKSRSISGPGIYLEKPVTPRKYVDSIRRMLNMEVTEGEEEAAALKEKLSDQLKGADAETLKKMLDVLKGE